MTCTNQKAAPEGAFSFYKISFICFCLQMIFRFSHGFRLQNRQPTFYLRNFDINFDIYKFTSP
jgi:hypothetical protein